MIKVDWRVLVLVVVVGVCIGLVRGLLRIRLKLVSLVRSIMGGR